jgi:hypothetical protein
MMPGWSRFEFGPALPELRYCQTKQDGPYRSSVDTHHAGLKDTGIARPAAAAAFTSITFGGCNKDPNQSLSIRASRGEKTALASHRK